MFIYSPVKTKLNVVGSSEILFCFPAENCRAGSCPVSKFYKIRKPDVTFISGVSQSVC